MTRRVALGGKPAGPMPQDGGAYVVIDGKWVAVAHDGADGVPAHLELPDKREGQNGATAPVRAAE